MKLLFLSKEDREARREARKASFWDVYRSAEEQLRIDHLVKASWNYEGEEQIAKVEAITARFMARKLSDARFHIAIDSAMSPEGRFVVLGFKDPEGVEHRRTVHFKG